MLIGNMYNVTVITVVCYCDTFILKKDMFVRWLVKHMNLDTGEQSHHLLLSFIWYLVS